MWNLIRSSIVWLHQPEHVARFQNYFGVLPLDEPPAKAINQNSTPKSKSINGHYQQHHERKVTYDTNVLDECLAEIQHSQEKKSDKTRPEMDYRIASWFWYYFFQFGSALGNEIFYIIFFPTWIWNVDGAVARKVGLLWATFMYLGQAMKDILQMPRPQTPPVLKLEKRYIEEYGFPSTHAMFAAGIPLSFVLLSYQRYEFPLWIGLTIAAFVCLWVCFSRIYLGMHTFLDIIAGSLIALLLIYLMFPFIDSIDHFLLNFSWSPLMNFLLGVLLIKYYPSSKQWSTARSDTAVILGSIAGFASAATMMHQFHFLEEPLTPPTYSIIAPNLSLCVLRTTLGLFIVYATRQVVKTLVLRLTCSFYGLDWKNPQSKRLAKVEMPYYYLTYFCIGFNIASTCPLVFQWLGINRDYSYTE